MIMYHWQKWSSRRYESSMSNSEMARMLTLIDVIIEIAFFVVVSARACFRIRTIPFSTTESLGSFTVFFLLMVKDALPSPALKNNTCSLLASIGEQGRRMGWHLVCPRIYNKHWTVSIYLHNPAISASFLFIQVMI